MPKLTHRRHRIGSLQASRPTTLRTLHFGTIRECEIPGMLYMNLIQTLHDAVPELEKLKIALKQKCARQERVRLSKEALQFPIHACGSRGEGHARSAGQNLCVMSSSSLAPMALAAALSSKDGEHSRGCLTAVEGHAGVGYRTIPWWQDVRAAGAPSSTAFAANSVPATCTGSTPPIRHRMLGFQRRECRRIQVV